LRSVTNAAGNQPLETVVTRAGVPDRGDAVAVAAELASAFRDVLGGYREYYKLSLADAVERATAPSPEYEQQVLMCPPDEVTWAGLENIAERDPERAQQRWEEVKQAAREELRSGHRAARAVEGGGRTLWERARFLAVRAELSEAWQPRDALEQQLIDQLAQWQSLLFVWQQALTAWTALAGCDPRPRGKRQADREPPRLTESEALHRAAAMAERCQRMYLHTLKTLQERRRVSPSVVVRNAGQINVAGQQLNVNR
jgi:hypothetical protein